MNYYTLTLPYDKILYRVILGGYVVETTKNQLLEAQRAKRKRVARMKKFILSFIAIWILVSIIVMTILCIRVSILQKQIDILSAKIENTQSVADSQQMVEDGCLDDVYKVENIDNFATDNDIKRVYLTFDDGPSENTNEILDILDDYNVKASFFVVGQDKSGYVEEYKRIVDEGHTIGMHSFSHKYSEIYDSKESFEQDYQQIHSMIQEVTGVDAKYYRFPGGSSNTLCNGSMSDFIGYLNSQNVTYFDWNVASGDANIQAYTSDELVDNVMKDVVQYKTSVVLLHDASDKDSTVEALPKLIEQLQASGVMILPIDESTTVIQHTSVVQ